MYKVHASLNPCGSPTRSDPGEMSSDSESDPGAVVVDDSPKRTKARIRAQPPRIMGGGYNTLPIVQTHSADDPRTLKSVYFTGTLFRRYGLTEMNTPLFLPEVFTANQARTPLLNTPVTFNTGPSSLPLDNGYTWVNFEGARMLISKERDGSDRDVIDYSMHSWLDYAPLITVSVEVRRGKRINEQERGPDKENIVLLKFYYSHKASTTEIDLWSLFFSPQKLGVSRISTADVGAIRAGKPPGTTDADVNALFGQFALVLFKDGDEVLRSRLRLSIPQLVRLAVEPACPLDLLEDRYVQIVVLNEYLRRMQKSPRYSAMKKFLRTKRGFKFLRFIQVDRATEKVLCHAATAKGETIGLWAEKQLDAVLGFVAGDPAERNEYLSKISQMEIVSLIEVETDVSESYFTKKSTMVGKMTKQTARYKINGMFKQMKSDPGYGLDTADLVLTYGSVVKFFKDFWTFLRSQFAGLPPALPDAIAAKIGDLELMRLTPADFGLGPDPVKTLQDRGLYRLMGPAIVDEFGAEYIATLATAGSFFDWTSAGVSK